MAKRTDIESFFNRIKEAAEEGKILVGVDHAWVGEWWKTVENLKVSFLGAHILLVAMWAPFIIGVVLFVNGKLFLALISFFVGVVLARFERYRRGQEFRKHVMSNPQSFARFYSLGAITLKAKKTGQTVSYPQKITEIIKEIG